METRGLRSLLWACLAAMSAGGTAPAIAGQTIEESGALACVVDKWDEKEQGTGHKRVAYAGRCISLPDDPALAKATGACEGAYEYMPDGSWKGSGTCTDTYKGGDTMSLTWEEGSHLKEYKVVKTGGTGKFKGVTGTGTYTREDLTDTLSGGRYKNRAVLP